ncbi:MAG: peptidylprolyl isomerase [Mogibacterium sp.]|nr:peptidylprolyl isomerase [Mogibacterium sp.]
MKKHIRIILVSLMTLSLIMLAGCGGGSSEQTEAPDVTEEETTAVETADPIGIHHAEIEIRDYGTVSVELDGDTAPVTVQNFMDLAGAGFYDGLTFHRIIDGFMIQGGDPNGDGTGGSGKNIVGEFSANGYENNIAHTKGVISMARAQDPDSASSQFFIMVEDAPHLDGQYAAFGHVTDGQDVVDKIAADAQPLDDNGTIAPEDQPVIETVKIID